MTKYKNILILLLTIVLSSCSSIKKSNTNDYNRYETTLPNCFDVPITFIAYTKTEDEFKTYVNIISEKLIELNYLFDIYNNYSDINNLKTINDNAGIAPIKVDKYIIDLLLASKDAYNNTYGKVNIAMGSVLLLWHDARTLSLKDTSKAYIPDMALLEQASENTDINNIVIDEENFTVFIKNKGMSLDVGAIAKGFATQIAIDEAKKIGLASAILNAGGNVITVGKPMDNSREKWGVGIQDPSDTTSIIDTIYTNSISVVTSGSYQRFYQVDNISYNHIIDPTTLMPSNNFTSVTILHPDGATADMLSTALFLLPLDEGKELLAKYNADAFWIYKDGTTEATDGYKQVSKSFIVN